VGLVKCKVDGDRCWHSNVGERCYYFTFRLMTYHQYNPTKDTIKVGSKIRLAGREGEVMSICSDTYEVLWPNPSGCNTLTLSLFPALEIADEPLTISPRLKEEIRRHLSTLYLAEGRETKERVEILDMEWLDSLEVVD
jgi:hypothetical protein